MDTFVLDTLLTYFNEEISNKAVIENDGLVVYLPDGTLAKIKATSLS